MLTITQQKKICLILEDNTIFKGKLLGFLPKEGLFGEVIFNTSMTGYQEIITDPSYKNQFIVFTYPSIGNYGVFPEDNEWDKPSLAGIIVKEYFDAQYNPSHKNTLENFLIKHNLPCLFDIDTRALVRHVRKHGVMRAKMFHRPEGSESDQGYISKIKEYKKTVQTSASMTGFNLTTGFSVNVANNYVQNFISKNNLDVSKYPHVCLLSFGTKFSIIKRLLEHQVLPIIYEGSSNDSSYLDKTFDGYVLSNGPGDPFAVKQGIENVKKVLEQKKPILAICLGHQILSLALGASTSKMLFGHHGGNHPVYIKSSSKVYITSQNHGFVVDKDTLELEKHNIRDMEINGNDYSLESFSMTYNNTRIISIQYHPEAGPGPDDTIYLFNQFKKLL